MVSLLDRLDPTLCGRPSGFSTKKEKKNPSLFDYAQKPVPIEKKILRREGYSKRVMLKHESETLGLVLSDHPLSLYGKVLQGMNYVRARDLDEHVGKYVTAIGWLITGKTVRTKKGDQMKFISFEDTTGIYETVFFPKVYNRYCHMLNASRPYVLKGRVEIDFGAININVSWIGFLDRYGKKEPSQENSMSRTRNLDFQKACGKV